jgi:GTP cyclohydrolase FolE2
MNKYINLETTTIYKKRKKNGKKGQHVFYLSKEHYQQRFDMEPLLIFHQQRFIGTTVVDIQASTTVPFRSIADTLEYKFSTHLTA